MYTQMYPHNVQQILDAVLEPDGNSSSELRQTVLQYAVALSRDQSTTVAPPAAWQSYIDTVTKQAYRITDAHIEQLKANGYSEDEIFELTIAAALGAGLARLEQGLAAVEGAKRRESCA